ncbi:hypothetical protein ES705_42447 [subsurface metagenome]
MVEVFTTGADKLAEVVPPTTYDPDGWVTFGEFIAIEDMYLIGCKHNVGGGPGPVQGTCCVTLTGNALNAESPMRHLGDETGYMWKFQNAGGYDTLTGDEGDIQMLPSGEYFFIEKGERFYAHGKLWNGAASAFDIAQSVLVYYTKKKP